jgi:hypothetical protein
MTTAKNSTELSPSHSTSRAQASSLAEWDGEDRCAHMSPLPGGRLVWSLYGRFWCRSSLEVLSVTHGRAGMWSRAMWRGQPSHQPRSSETPRSA